MGVFLLIVNCMKYVVDNNDRRGSLLLVELEFGGAIFVYWMVNMKDSNKNQIVVTRTLSFIQFQEYSCWPRRGMKKPEFD